MRKELLLHRTCNNHNHNMAADTISFQLFMLQHIIINSFSYTTAVLYGHITFRIVLLLLCQDAHT